MNCCSSRYQLAEAPSRASTDMTPNRILKVNMSWPGRFSFKSLRLLSKIERSGNVSPRCINCVSSRSMGP